jgi:protein involved in polysaccharide export with SLBB domain
MRNILTTFCCFFAFTILLQAQVPADVMRTEVNRRGFTEAEVSKKLMERGIDINKVQPEDLPGLEQTMQEVIDELEAEKAAKEAAAKPDTLPTRPNDGQPLPPRTPQQRSDTLAVSKPPMLTDTITPIVKPDSVKEIYGHALFRGETALNYDPNAVRPPDSYVLGPGDGVSISIFGNSQASFLFEVSQAGYIQPPGMGRIYLKGTTLGKARTLLRSRFGQYYNFTDGQFDVSISYARGITVNIVGEVSKPGSYTLPATNTVFSALVAAGGPTDIGTVRVIKLLRNGQPTRMFDVYDFLQNPLLETDFFLENNDYIHVQVVESVVEIDGAVRRPYRYELKKGESLRKLIELAGGLKENAYRRTVQVTRFVEDEEVFMDVEYAELLKNNEDFELFPGDIVSVQTIARSYENFVEISGSVDFPGRFQWRPGMRVSDLLQRGVLQRESRRDVAYLFRTLPDESVRLVRLDLETLLKDPESMANLSLEARDRVQIFSQVTFFDQAEIRSSGALRSPVQIPYDPDEGVRVADLVLLSGGLLPNAAEFAYIKRTDPGNRSNIDYIRLNIRQAVADTASIDNRNLRAFDELLVYTNEQFVDDAVVNIYGSVRLPTTLQYDDGLRVSDLIFFAEGLQPDAADFAYIRRTNLESRTPEYIRVDLIQAMQNPEGAANPLLMPFDSVQVLSKTRFLEQATVRVEGAVREPGVYDYDRSLTLQDVLTLAGGLRFGAASNRVEISRVLVRDNQPTQTIVAIVEVNDLFEIVGGTPGGLELEPYDQIIVRNVPDFKLQENVTILGEVQYPGMHPLLGENERLLSLVERAGGLTTRAFADGATLFREQDSVGYIIMNLSEVLRKPDSRFNFILKPGDIIEIPTQQDLVRITGATRVKEMYPEEILKGGAITVPFHKGRRAGFYIRKYAAGIGEDGRFGRVTVQHPNGEIQKTRLFFTPKVRKGSVVQVGTKPEKPKDPEEAPKEPVDWARVVADTIAQATAVLSLILLIQRVN